ncbi:MAG TPA: hypothetical protein VMT69_10040 [Kineosporiaceae bacterium]|nr:hypothetical protein [Kineosporiaceae bacterium]
MTVAETAMRAVRRAGVATLAAEALVGVFCVVATRTHAVRITSPCGSDLDDAVVTCTILVLPLLAVPTGVRLLAHRGSAFVPAEAARAVVAGSLTGLAVTAAALLACADALARSTAGVPPPARGLGLAGAAAAVVATAMTVRAGDTWRPVLARRDHMPAAARPDLADELASLAASWLPGSLLARTAAWLDRGLDVWRVSPRRHPWAAVVAAAWSGGLLLAQWHAAREGPWSGLRPALVFAGTVAAVIGGGLAVGVAWLGLLRRAAQQTSDGPSAPGSGRASGRGSTRGSRRGAGRPA